MQKNHKRVGRFDTAASGVSGTGNKAAMHVFMMASATTVHGNESNNGNESNISALTVVQWH